MKREGWQGRPLSLAETSASAAAFHLAMGRLTEAAAEIQQARGADPSLAMTTDVEGALFERTREPEKAQIAFEKAIGAGSTNFYTYYRLAAMLSPDASRETVTRIESLLERSVSLNNAYAPTQIMLSNVMVQLGKPDAALNSARRAVALDPNGFSAQFALARALSAGAQFAEALRESRHALAVAANDPEKQAATNLLQRSIADAVARVAPPSPSPPPQLAPFASAAPSRHRSRSRMCVRVTPILRLQRKCKAW